MLTTKLVPFVARNMIARNASLQGNVIAGPPTKKVSKGEKFVCATVMVVGFLTIPSWVLCHMQEYKSR